VELTENRAINVLVPQTRLAPPIDLGVESQPRRTAELSAAWFARTAIPPNEPDEPAQG